MKTIILTSVFFYCTHTLIAQCPVNAANIYNFSVNNVNYEIIKENLEWTAASACAVSRGGKLVEINSQQEQDSIFYHVNQAGIIASNTVGWDGGGASYLWIGGNDLTSEGNWVWNGDNNGTATPFWIGTSSGSPVGGLYSNWGNEPDNWNQQDGLGFAFTDWPFGVAGQWNDIFATDELYYIIEYLTVAETPENKQDILFTVYPNPATTELHVNLPANSLATIRITDLTGKILVETTAQSTINVAALTSGTYIVTLISEQKNYSRLFLKE